MLEGQVAKECLLRILDEVTEIYSKWTIVYVWESNLVKVNGPLVSSWAIWWTLSKWGDRSRSLLFYLGVLKVGVCAILESESNMLRVEEPVIIIGDIHGQFFDMIHMFEKVVDPKGIPQ